MTRTSVSLTWSASTDNVGRHRVPRVRERVGSVLNPVQPGATVTALACGTAYTFEVDATTQQATARAIARHRLDGGMRDSPVRLDVLRERVRAVQVLRDEGGPIRAGQHVHGAAGVQHHRVLHERRLRRPCSRCAQALRVSRPRGNPTGAGRSAGRPDAAVAARVSRRRVANADQHRPHLVCLRLGQRRRDRLRPLSRRQPGRHVSTTTGIFSGLTCNTNYTLAVDALDAAANRSQKTTVLVSTTACADTTPPSSPTGLAASNVTQTSLTLTWNASTDNVGVTGYDVYRNGTKMASVTSRSSSQTGLACGTSYWFGVEALDAAGNRSARVQRQPDDERVSAAAAAAPNPSGPITITQGGTYTGNWTSTGSTRPFASTTTEPVTITNRS